MLTVLIFILLLSVLIFVHEFGHFLAARIVGVKVEEFAFGLPFTKPIISKTVKGLKLSIYPILFGGFVKLYGEDGELGNQETGKLGNKGKKTAFFEKTKLQRTFVILAGVFMNFLLGIIVIAYIFTQGVLAPTEKVTITKIIKNSPAESAGLKVNDIISEIDSKKVKDPEDLINYTQKKLGKSIILTIIRKEEGRTLGASFNYQYPTVLPKPVKEKVQIIEKTLKIVITPRLKYPANEGPMGVGISNLEIKKFSLLKAPVLGTIEAVNLSYQILRGLGRMIWELFVQAKAPKDVAGPIGIAQLTGEAVKFGYLAVLQLLALLSLNLAIVNALPFPALDGGRLVFIFAEGIFGKKVRPKIEQIVNNIGMAILLTLILVITIGDLNRIFNLSGLIGKLFHK